MTKITVNLPAEMEPYVDSFEYFVRTMVQKLYTNRHKGFEKTMSLQALLGGAASELNEVEDALDNQGQFEVAVEAADLANMGFLLALVSTHMTRREFEEARAEMNRAKVARKHNVK